MLSFFFIIAPVFISESRTNSICLPISIWKQDGKIIGANTLIGSGAMGCFILKDTVQRLGLPIQKLDQTVWAWNVDDTPNKSGLVKYKTNIVLDYRKVREHWNLFILNYRKDKVILGLPWLWAINPEINWKDGSITIIPANYRWTTREPPKVLEQRYLLWYMLYDEAAHIEDELYDTFKTWMPEQCAKFFNASSCIPEFIIKWTTVSTIITQEATKGKVILPMVFKEYKDIFSEKTPTKLPPSRSYDHAIELKDLFILQWAKAYPLNPIKHQAYKEFIKEYLKTGKISPSKSSQAVPFFFVKKKKAGKLQPCQDYQYLNSHTIKNAYLLPLISNLVDKLWGSLIVMKFDIQWGYNNILIKPEDWWKAAFTTPLGLFEPNIMFFRMCNSPATFQAFMDGLFGDYITEG